MKAMREWGHDYYCVECPINEVIARCKAHRVSIYDIWLKDNLVFFYASLLDRNRILQSFPKVQLIKTSGIVGFVLQQCKKPRRIIAILSSVATILVCVNSIFTIQIRGSSRLLEKKISETLSQQLLLAPMKKLSATQFHATEQALKESFFDEIEWINLSNVGSAYFIDYVPRLRAQPQPKTMEPLLAYKSGVIARFDVKRGVKLVKEHDYVRAGDVLVTSDVLNSNNQIESGYVEGKVFAYTHYLIEADMKENLFSQLTHGFSYFQLLFDCRRQISVQIQQKEYIAKENILLFQVKQGRIVMRIHYTLFEDISRP